MSTDTQNNAPVSAEPTLPDALADALSNLEHDNYERSYSGSKNRESDATLIRAALAQQDATLHAEVLDMVRMLEANEWADHCGKSELGQRLEWAITALQNRPQNIPEIIPESAQQDASKVDAALAKMVHAMFRSANSIPVTRITIDRKQYEAAIDAARKGPA